MNVLPTGLMKSFTTVLDALRPLRFDEQRRVLHAAEVAIVDAASNADLAKLQREAVRSPTTILPSIHPDSWTMPPKLPPLPPPPSDEAPQRKKTPRKNRRRNPK